MRTSSPARGTAAALALAALVAVLPGAVDGQQPRPPDAPRFSGPSSQTLHQILNDYWEWRLADEPELATRVGRREVNDRWTDWSSGAREQARRTRQEYLERVMFLTPGTLNPQDYLSALLVEYELRAALEAGPWLESQLVAPNGAGVHNRLVDAIQSMPTQTVADYDSVLARLRALPAYIDRVLVALDDQLARGRAQPAVVVDLVLEQVRAQRQTPAGESRLLDAFSRFPASLPASAQRRLRSAALLAYEQQFLPGLDRLDDYLRNRYRPRARQDVGLSGTPGGADAYARLVRHHTSTSLSPKEIHDLGVREVARLENEMRAILGEYGFTGTIAEFEADLARRPGMRFESEDEMVAFAEDVVASVQPRLATLFLRVPRTPVRVRSAVPDRAGAMASSYDGGSADGTRPAYFNMNTVRPTEQMRYTTEALVLHETLPGRHLQVGLARLSDGLPAFRSVTDAPAFEEGWALYAESLGVELGGVYRDPTTRFGRLSSELSQAASLVVDTGIHAFGWTRDRARAYFREHVPSRSLVEIDQYISAPGQALAAKIGEVRIRSLRQRAERELGPRFDVREFHDVVLRNGVLPLELLDDEVQRYVTNARGAPSR